MALVMRIRPLVAAIVGTAVLAGCGGTRSVSPATYVKSVCAALGNWKNTIQSAGVALQSSGASSASRPVAKEDYQRFVAALVIATRRATRALKSAGAPTVAHGNQIAARLTRAFDRATGGLDKASAQAKRIRTDSPSAFQLGASAVSAEIKSALEEIARVTPGQDPALRKAASKEPACQLLAS
jgi:hypothetical protein